MTENTVDISEIGFWQGRQFRSFLELNISAGQSVVVRFTAASDFILKKQDIAVDAGSLKLTALRGGTSGGSWSAMPVISKNIMSVTQPVTPKNSIETGGTVTGGTAVEIVRIVASNATAQASTVGGSGSDQRGLAAGVYHIKLENIGNGAVTGVYTIIFEERPLGTTSGV